MRSTPYVACLIAIVVLGCTTADRRDPASVDSHCAVTPPIESPAPESTEGGPAGDETASWYILDAPAPPLVFDTPPADSYRYRFTPSDMTFPTGGCWEIIAKVDESEARFVVKVSAGPAGARVE